MFKNNRFVDVFFYKTFRLEHERNVGNNYFMLAAAAPSRQVSLDFV